MSIVLDLPNVLDQTAPAFCPAVSAPIAFLDRVTKRYRNGVIALDGISLTLRPGEIVALLGPNGAGKSTAVKLILGLTAPSAGTIAIFGRDPRMAAHRLRTGAMLQVGRAPETLKVSEHLELFRGYYPHPLPTADLVEAAGLHGLEDRLFGALSGGQKQRVLFALALAGDPDLVVLDEPTVGLDIEARRSLWTQIRFLAARGKTVLLTTHYLEEADALASRIVVMAHGRVVCEGTPDEIRTQGAARTLHAQPATSTPATSGPATLPPAASGTAISMPEGADFTGPGKLIRCRTTLTAEQLRSLPQVCKLECAGGRASLTTTAPELTLRTLLALDPTLSELEVTHPALEDAFLALTTHEI